MIGEDVMVVGAGMTTSVGLTAGQTAAAVRASLARFQEATWIGSSQEPFTVASVPDEHLTDLQQELAGGLELPRRETRLLGLAAMALVDCASPLAQTGKARSLCLALALPEMELSRPLDPTAFLERLALVTEGIVDPATSQSSPKGRAGGLLAVGQAVRQIQEGAVRVAVAGGVDSYVEYGILDQLDAERRIKSALVLDGFIPGEGAGFLLLASRGAAERANLTPLARLSAVSVGFEPGHLYSEDTYRGEGLDQAFKAFFRARGLTQPIREVYSSMNGESHWAREWGVAYLRNRKGFDLDHGMNHPADCFGDTGAACGPLMVGLAAIGIARGYRRSPCLVYGSSDRGERAVIAVSRP
jgi:3-oxoacyl-[acyl-carrier-protein] synthase-1